MNKLIEKELARAIVGAIKTAEAQTRSGHPRNRAGETVVNIHVDDDRGGTGTFVISMHTSDRVEQRFYNVAVNGDMSVEAL